MMLRNSKGNSQLFRLVPATQSVAFLDHVVVFQPDYEQQLMDESRFRQQLEARNKSSKKNERKHDDPYYCGLRARIPNFAKSKAQKEREREREKESKYAGIGAMRDIGGIGGHHLVWGGPQRGYMDNGE